VVLRLYNSIVPLLHRAKLSVEPVGYFLDDRRYAVREGAAGASLPGAGTSSLMLRHF
jgi:hypothetical protein